MNSSFVLFPIAASVALTGCGGVADHDTTHHLSIHTDRPAQPVTASIRAYRKGTFHSPQTLTTDSHGDAHANFRSTWASAFFVVPPIGSIPWRAPTPSYLVTFHGRDTVVSPAKPNTTYLWRDGAWFTETSIASH